MRREETEREPVRMARIVEHISEEDEEEEEGSLCSCSDLGACRRRFLDWGSEI